MAARLTVHLVGESLFRDTVRRQMADVSELAFEFCSEMENETADTFYLRLLEAARSSGGRLLVVDQDGKVQADTFDEVTGERLALSEMWSVLDGKADGDYGFHLLTSDEEEVPSLLRRAAEVLLGRSVGGKWVGCFCVPLDGSDQTSGALLLIASVQSTVDSLDEMQLQMLGVFFLTLLIVLITAGLITRVITRPVAALSAGIEHMGRGDYQHRVHVSGKGEMAQLAWTRC